MIGNFKVKRIRNPEHLKFIRTLPCCVCGKDIGCDPHHENEPMQGSKSIKVGDNQVVPLCHYHHTLRHNIGRVGFWGDKDPIILANSLYRCFIGYGIWERRERALMAINRWRNGKINKDNQE